jgi:hypothetical protein
MSTTNQSMNFEWFPSVLSSLRQRLFNDERLPSRGASARNRLRITPNHSTTSGADPTAELLTEDLLRATARFLLMFVVACPRMAIARARTVHLPAAYAGYTPPGGERHAGFLVSVGMGRYSCTSSIRHHFTASADWVASCLSIRWNNLRVNSSFRTATCRQ